MSVSAERALQDRQKESEELRAELVASKAREGELQEVLIEVRSRLNHLALSSKETEALAALKEENQKLRCLIGMCNLLFFRKLLLSRNCAWRFS